MSKHGNKKPAENKPAPQTPPAAVETPSKEAITAEAPQVSVGDWQDQTALVRRTFPGPEQTDVPLRVACERAAYAELIAHAKESLEAEICGVLVGEMCEDNQGGFVHVKAVIRGNQAKEHGTHVTYTQETWNAIHQELEQKYPRLNIVGWYHSHPGFGVEFSDMDLFIQKNFFSGPMQLALVTDPLGGDEAICFNSPDGIRHVDRFWVDGRQRMCHVPAKSKAVPAEGKVAATSELGEALQRVETRLAQLLQAQDRQQVSFHRFLLTTGMVVMLGVALWLAFTVYHAMTSALEPPRINGGFIPVPIQIGDQQVLVGLSVVKWNVPPELNAILVQLEEKRQAAEAAKAKEIEELPEAPPEKGNEK